MLEFLLIIVAIIGMAISIVAKFVFARRSGISVTDAETRRDP
ncbi:hypothetical protein [Collimonas silvisoli]|nr:hypothetical protein [Collimonas silvisoli]